MVSFSKTQIYAEDIFLLILPSKSWSSCRHARSFFCCYFSFLIRITQVLIKCVFLHFCCIPFIYKNQNLHLGITIHSSLLCSSCKQEALWDLQTVAPTIQGLITLITIDTAKHFHFSLGYCSLPSLKTEHFSLNLR